MSPFTAEVIGTAILILLGNGVVANVVLQQTKGSDSGFIVITWGWGIAVFTAVLVTMDYSGAHLNPAVSIGLATAGKFPWSQVPLYVFAQLIGAMIGTTMVWIMYRDHYEATPDKDLKRASFCTSPAIPNTFRNFFSEVIGTFVLIFSVLYISGPNFMVSTPDAPAGLGSLGALPVGLIVLGIGLSLGGTTGYAINPARDLGPRVIHAILPMSQKGDSEWHYAWVPVIGPIIGALAAAGLHLLLAS